ncbi:PspC domain-containing protein [Pedobacter arcticus]|uniref:PspC domain-containing protein n=1 Tax=Pedobacter arcticus TaxID=752140 RepID=UPI00030D25D1|nr:PspC domain-containing protein [Pedobacter arcticus]
MNKTIIINISGVIFHIEEDAYQLLKSYMDDIKRHFASYKDSFEIVSDIESRVAEMFSEQLLADKKQVIVITDVTEVTTRMGKPADFETEEDNENASNHEPATSTKKLFRDTEDRFIGGVCSGIGHYFGIEAKWVRVSFIVLLIFFGFSILPYILFWIVMPRAITRAEKMEMKGEKINLQSFQKNIEEELNAVKENFKNARKNAPTIEKIIAFIKEVVDKLISILGITGKLAIKFFAIVIMFILGALLTVAFVFLMIFLGYIGSAEVETMFPLNMINEGLRPILLTCAFLVAVIPLISLIFILLRVVFNSRTISRNITLGLAAIWILAVATGTFFIAKISTDFKQEASYSETINLKPNATNIYILRLGDERTIQENFYDDSTSNRIIKITGSDADFDTPDDLDFDLKVADGDLPMLSKTYAARGRNFKQALQNAHKINYYYHQQDSVLTFDYHYGLKDRSLWRSQKVAIKLHIPINSNLLIEKRLANRFFSYELDDCIDEDANDDSLIAITVTKAGFSCKKTAEAIKHEKADNTRRNVNEEVSDTVIF